MNGAEVVWGLVSQIGGQPGRQRIDLLVSRLDEPVIVAFVLGIILGLFLLAVELVTLLYVWLRARRESRRDRLRPAIKDGLIRRLAEPEPDWADWFTQLDDTERELLREQLDTFLRKFDGHEGDNLRTAGEALGIHSEAIAAVRSGDRNERLRGFIWLTLLRCDVETEFVRRHCSQDAMTRAVAARLLYETGAAEAARVGTEILLAVPDQPMTSFGVDTLYRLHEGNPTGLFEFADDHVDAWSTTVTLQVLLVIHELSMVRPDAPVGWLASLFDHDAPEVRAGAARAFVRYGWREELREHVEQSELVADESPLVRRAACELLASWGDDGAVRRLRSLATTDESARVRIAATQGLLTTRNGVSGDEWLPEADRDAAVRWVLAQRAISSTA